MKRRTLIHSLGGLAAVALTFAMNCAFAQQTEADKVKATIDALHTALGARDVAKIQDLWANDSYVMAVQPRDKSVATGADAVRQSFENAVAAWADLKVTQSAGPNIHVSGNVAWATGIALAGGKLKSGDMVPGVPTFETDVLEMRGGRWLFVSHVATRVPQ